MAEPTTAVPEREVSGHRDPAGETPWAMQLVVRAEKTDPPGRTQVCEAAAKAVVAVLDDARAVDRWAPAISRWQEGRIRKHVRRARGARWERSQEAPGVTVEWEGAEVRACVPTPVDEIYPDVARLQLSGLELEDPDRKPVSNPGMFWDLPTLVIAVAAEPELGVGKAAAACGHAAQVAWLEAGDYLRDEWMLTGYAVQVMHLGAEKFTDAATTADVVIRDAGFTEVEAGTVTAVAWWVDDQTFKKSQRK